MDIEQFSKRKLADGSTQNYIPEHTPAFIIDFSRKFSDLEGFLPGGYLNYYWLDTLRKLSTDAQWAEITALPLWLSWPNGRPGQWTVDLNGEPLTRWSTHGWDVDIHQWTFSDEAGMDGNWFAGGPTYWKTLGKQG